MLPTRCRICSADVSADVARRAVCLLASLLLPNFVTSRPQCEHDHIGQCTRDSRPHPDDPRGSATSAVDAAGLGAATSFLSREVTQGVDAASVVVSALPRVPWRRRAVSGSQRDSRAMRRNSGALETSLATQASWKNTGLLAEARPVDGPRGCVDSASIRSADIWR